MSKTGIRKFKAHLSFYINKVKKGESIVITDRGQEVAQMIPIDQTTKQKNKHEWIWKLVREGRLSWDGKRPTGLKHRIKIKGKPMSQTIIEGRAERF